MQLRLPAVVVLVGPPASGKTTLRRRIVAAGFDPRCLVSLDDTRRELLGRTLRAGRPALPMQDYTVPAARICLARQTELLAAGAGYLADNTHLRRAERLGHVRASRAAGLSAVGLLTPVVSLDELVRRNVTRPDGECVPHDVLVRHHDRRGQLSASVLVEEGFQTAEVVDADEPITVVGLR